MVDKYEFYSMVDDIFKSCETTKEMVLRCIELKDIADDIFKQNYALKVAEEKVNG